MTLRGGARFVSRMLPRKGVFVQAIFWERELSTTGRQKLLSVATGHRARLAVHLTSRTINPSLNYISASTPLANQ